jgi:hypothetical protein
MPPMQHLPIDQLSRRMVMPRETKERSAFENFPKSIGYLPRTVLGFGSEKLALVHSLHKIRQHLGCSELC